MTVGRRPDDMIATERARHVSPLTGAFNFRDLGGLPARDGRVTRFGALFRSDTLQALMADDAAHLVDGLGIEVIIDLRLAREAIEEGRGLLADHPSLCYVNAPLAMASAEAIPGESPLVSLYRGCMAPESPLPRVIALIAAMAGHPTVFHCAAGKDRTGLVAAIVLRLLGVEDTVIVADYLASRANMAAMLARFQTWPRYRDHLAAMPPEVYAVEEGPLRSFLADLDARHGGADAWAARCGIGPQLIEHLREKLLVGS